MNDHVAKTDGIKDWLARGKAIIAKAENTAWEIGDWMIEGEQRWGSKYREAMELSGFEYGTLRVFACVSKGFELLRRRNKLRFGHHQEVLALDAPQQDEWLNKAEANQWSVHELRRNLRLELRTEEPERITVGFSPQTWALELILFERKNPCDKWPASQRAAMKEELKPIVEIYERL